VFVCGDKATQAGDDEFEESGQAEEATEDESSGEAEEANARTNPALLGYL
jgi:hypothetical protein